MFAALEEVIRETAASAGAPDFSVVSEIPPSPDQGDLAFPAAFGLARHLRRPPREIAETLAEALAERPEVRRVEVAGPGYVNVFLNREMWIREALAGTAAETPDGIHVVEHTSINPNKAAHIGHLRNAALGDSFARILRFLGHRIEVQTYTDDTGVQVADVVLGFLRLRGADTEEVRRLAGQPRFDYLCWDLYAEVSRWIEEHPEGPAARKEALHGLEHGEAPWAEIGNIVATANARRHLETMERIGVRYDLLPCEKSILQLHFWERAFELLRDRGAIRLSESGRNRGCWVMDTPLAQDGEKVIVRSNGTVTYVGKDIAYQMWQLGLLDRDFRWRRFYEYPDGRRVWMSTSEPEQPDTPAFGSAALVHHVIDARQSYPQQVVQEAVARLTSEAERARTRHLSYEMVALTPATVAALGLGAAAGDGAVEVSGRKGIGIKADDFLDALLERASEEVAARNPDLSAQGRRSVAFAIAVGALRYLMVRVTKNQLIVFDLEEALSLEGATGPYLQYAAVRAAKILARVERVLPQAPPPPPEGFDSLLSERGAEEAADLWVLLRGALGLREAAATAAAGEDPQVLARWAYEGAQRFNAFYHRYRIAGEPDPNARLLRTYAVETFLAQHRQGLALLGIPVPERM
ncbi:MAG: arginine--tRNA ligase [Acidobacteria bacterium]|nr:arginine--tRNA ligase [Acidobacteriota bacterium]